MLNCVHRDITNYRPFLSVFQLPFSQHLSKGNLRELMEWDPFQAGCPCCGPTNSINVPVLKGCSPDIFINTEIRMQNCVLVVGSDDVASVADVSTQSTSLAAS